MLALAAAALGVMGAAAAQPLRVRPLRALEAPPPAPALATRPQPSGTPGRPLWPPTPIPESGSARLDLRSHFLDFGSVASDEARELPEAIVLRVVSEEPWYLWLTCGGVRVEERGRRLPASRLAWRGAGGGQFQRLQTGAPVLVARGPATGPAGLPVAIDLRLDVDDEDPMGGLRADVRLQLAH